jgi:hypothetical protein
VTVSVGARTLPPEKEGEEIAPPLLGLPELDDGDRHERRGAT